MRNQGILVHAAYLVYAAAVPHCHLSCRLVYKLGPIRLDIPYMSFFSVYNLKS